MGPAMMFLLACLPLVALADGDDGLFGMPFRRLCGKENTVRDCWTSCQNTCRYPYKTEISECQKNCVERGCYCAKGFVLHEDECIRPQDCPTPRCSVNETRKEYARLTEPTCRDPHPTSYGGLFALDACVCKRGMLRGHDGNCYLPMDCDEPVREGLILPQPIQQVDTDEPEDCSDPHEILDCFNSCENSCLLPEMMEKSSCHEDCSRRQCRCKEGFYRYKGRCVEYDSCPFEEEFCAANETLTACGSNLEISCMSPIIVNFPDVCLYKTCMCKKGYIRDDLRTGACIRVRDCPKMRLY